MTRTAPNRRMTTSAHVLHQTAVLVTQALDHLKAELEHLDGYPPSPATDGQPHSRSQPDSLVERIANARYELLAQREQIRDDLYAVEEVVNSLTHVCRAALGMRGPSVDGDLPKLCDPARYPDALVPDDDGGWSDYHCRQVADKAGLCDRCYMRRRRFLLARGLLTREDGGVWRGESLLVAFEIPDTETL